MVGGRDGGVRDDGGREEGKEFRYIDGWIGETMDGWMDGWVPGFSLTYEVSPLNVRLSRQLMTSALGCLRSDICVKMSYDV